MYNHFANVQSKLTKIYESEYKTNWFKYILDNPQLQWDLYEISGNPLVSINIVLNNSNFPWNFRRLSINPSIYLSDILETPQFPWEWDYVSTSPNVNFSDILAHPEIPWNMNWFCHYNKNPITKEIIFMYPDLPWDYFSVCSGNYKIVVQDIIDHPTLDWKWSNLVASEYFTLTEILENFPEHMVNISRNPNITMADILAHPEIDWDFSQYAVNPKLRFQDVLDNPQFNWNYSTVSQYCQFTIDDILANPDFPWDWTHMVQKKTIKFQDILDNSTLPWKYENIYQNPNITFEDILNTEVIQKCDNLDIYSKIFYQFKNRNIISIEDALKYPQIPVSKINLFSKDENVSFEFVTKNSDNFLWNYRELSANSQSKSMKKYVDERLKHSAKIFELEEDLVKIALHPKRIRKYLEMGYEVFDLDNLL